MKFLSFLIYFIFLQVNKFQAKNLEPTRAALKKYSSAHEEDVKPLEFPFVVAIYRHKLLVCAGSLVREDLVLTHSACLYAFEIIPFYVVAGGKKDLSINQEEDDSTKQKVKVSGFFLYNSSSDICLLHLESSLKRSETVQTIKLPTIPPSDYNFTSGLALGWKPTNDNPPKNLPILKKLQLSISDKEVCENNFKGSFKGGYEFCAGTENDGFCSFDTGGPFVLEQGNFPSGEANISATLFGFYCFSSEQYCARDYGESLYIKVSPYISWIEEMFCKIPFPKDPTTPPLPQPVTSSTEGADERSSTFSTESTTFESTLNPTLTTTATSCTDEPEITTAVENDSQTMSRTALFILIFGALSCLINCAVFCIVVWRHFYIGKLIRLCR